MPEFAVETMPIVRVWCRQNDAQLPKLWQQGEAQAVVRHLENSGLLDFEVLDVKEMPTFCVRADCWPEGMPTSLDESTLGINTDAVAEEERRRERERQQIGIELRSIQFAGRSLDTGDPMFAESLQVLAESWLANDESWLERSRQRTRLVEFSNAAHSADNTAGGGKGGGAVDVSDS